MAEDNDLETKAEVINGQLIDGKIENDYQKKLDKEFQLQPHYETIRTWVKLLKDIWIGEEKKVVKVVHSFS